MINQKDRREHTVRYLMQMASEMKKMADGMMMPSLSLLFAMAADEASDFLDRYYPQELAEDQPSPRQQRNQATAMPDKAAGKI